MFIIMPIISLFLIHSKNIILPFNKVSFEAFIGHKLIDDYINYDIYTDILMGTPPQKVTHFIEPNDSIFQFKRRSLQYNNKKFNSSFAQIETNIFSSFDSEKSSTYVGYYSETFIFSTYNSKSEVEVPNLNFTVYLNNRIDIDKYGIIGLFTMIKPSKMFGELYSFVYQLKLKGIISDYVYSILYENNIDYFYGNIKLGTIFIGEYSYSHNEKISKAEEIKIYSASTSHWSFTADEIKFIYKNKEYVENHVECNFDFFSKFIKGTKKYNEKIKELFFDELLNKNLCDKKEISENKGINKYEIYSCNNTNFVQGKIKEFPTLNLTIKSDNIFFTLTYFDLFKLFNDRLYFIIIFPLDKYIDRSSWLIGEIFFRKFNFDFNLESKSISFYKNQIKLANNLIYNENEINKQFSNNFIRNLIEILMGIVIIFCIYLIYRKYRKSRKLHANELEDSNYTYVPNEINKKNQLMKENELKKD